MLRLRWFETEPDDASTPNDWHAPVLILATLFLNVSFWYVLNLDLRVPGPLPRYAGVLGAGAVLITTLFFLGPALATQAAKRPLLLVVENSLGVVPAFGLRFCCVCFLVRWIAHVIEVPVMWWLSSILRREVSSAESGLIAAGVLVFLFVTGLQSLRTTARLALFTNKLGIAILAAALLRVRDGWPAILKGFPDFGGHATTSELWQGLAVLALYVAPLAFLAADFGCRSQGRKQVAMIGLAGPVVPLSGTLFVIGAIDVATGASRFYQPSLQPNVGMALWAHAADSYLPGPMLLVAITTFGAVRFGARALAESVSTLVPQGRRRWMLLACLAGATAWLSVQGYAAFAALFELSATCIAVTASILTADLMAARRPDLRVPRFDWVGVAAVLSGCATPLFLPRWMVGARDGELWHRWLLPAYGVGFLVCLLGRTLQKIAMAKSSS